VVGLWNIVLSFVFVLGRRRHFVALRTALQELGDDARSVVAGYVTKMDRTAWTARGACREITFYMRKSGGTLVG
jgi:hypothetical protein